MGNNNSKNDAKKKKGGGGLNFLNAFQSFQDLSQLFGGVDVPTGKVFGKACIKLADIPPFLTDMMGTLTSKKYVKEVGIFRKNGKKDQIDEIVEVLDMGDDFPMKDMLAHTKNDIHTIAGVFKLYYRRMPDCLLHFKFYDDWIAIAALKKGEKKKEAVKKQLMKLIPAHLKMCKSLCLFLVEVSKFSKKNYMGTDNLSLVFAPNLLRPQELDMTSFKDAGKICLLVQYLVENPSVFPEDDQIKDWVTDDAKDE